MMPISFCPHCGTAVQPDDTFCMTCGFHLASRAGTGVAVPAVATAAAAPASPAASLFGPSLEAPLPPPVVRTGAGGHRSRRRRHRSRLRRLLGMAALTVTVVVLAVTAYLAYRVVSTFSAMHELSTPPPQLDAQVLGGTPGVKVDSAPALTAVATYAQGASIQVTPAPTRPASATAPSGGIANGRDASQRSAMRGLAQPAATAADSPSPLASPEPVAVPDSVQLFLLMGVDARPGEPIDIGVRPDSLSVAAYDTATASCRLLSIPRDARVELPGYGLSKINHALAVGGIPYQTLVVERFLGVRIDHYALIDFSGMAALIDRIGGVDLVITDDPFTIDGYTFTPGPVHLTGKEALAFSRYRYGPDGDFGRIRRQHQVIRAAVDELASSSAPSVARLVPDTLDSLAAHVRTDLSANELTDLGTAIIDHCAHGNATDETVQGAASTFRDPLLDMDLWYLTVDTADRDRKVQWLVSGDLPPAPAATPAP